MISIVMPTYNRESYLAECIESILAQTYKDFELLVVDDGSTDSTKDLMKYYVEKDSRIRYFEHPSNLGISVARNTGVEYARGDYIAVMDSDDLMHPKRLKASLRGLQKVDFVYSSYYLGDSEGKVTGIVKPPREVTIENVKENSAWPHVTIVAKADCFKNNPYREDFKVNDDAWLVYKFLEAKYTNKWIKEPMVIVRDHSSNISKTKAKEIAKTQKIMDKEYDGYNGV